MKKKLLAIAFVVMFVFGLTSSALAQSNYLFSVPKETVDVYWNSDGSESIEYTLDIVNQPGAHEIDYVDFGMPNNNFDTNNASADANGVPVSVSTTDYQGSGSGFSVVMGSQTIPAGGSGTVHLLINNITGVVYPDSNDSNYASADFAPSYFGSQYIVGNTDLTMTFHLPPGVKPEEPRWHDAPSGFPSQPQTGIDSQNRITYTWQSTNASVSEQYTFGASFPKSYIPDSAIVQTSALDVIVGILTFLISNIANILCFGFFGFMFLGLPIISAIQGSRRKLQYIPPKIGIEGHGIKRGLTAVEAAILMEQPLDKVMTMTLFGVVKKGAATVVSREPLKVQVTEPAPADLHDYEITFLNAFKIDDVRARQTAMQDMMIALVKSVGEKMKGFSRNETIAYYKNIMEQAWAQVAAANTPEIKSQKFDDNLEWTMLDKEYDDRTRRTFTGPILMPMWWGHYDPTYRPAPTTASTTSFPSSSGRGSSALPGADIAASMVTGVQTFSSKVVGDLNTFTSKITNVTNPPPPPSSSSGGSHGGGGCACACACAGCACACAGGGR